MFEPKQARSRNGEQGKELKRNQETYEEKYRLKSKNGTISCFFPLPSVSPSSLHSLPNTLLLSASFLALTSLSIPKSKSRPSELLDWVTDHTDLRNNTLQYACRAHLFAQSMCPQGARSDALNTCVKKSFFLALLGTRLGFAVLH